MDAFLQSVNKNYVYKISHKLCENHFIKTDIKYNFTNEVCTVIYFYTFYKNIKTFLTCDFS